jgi:hypothetical protein
MATLAIRPWRDLAYPLSPPFVCTWRLAGFNQRFHAFVSANVCLFVSSRLTRHGDDGKKGVLRKRFASDGYSFSICYLFCSISLLEYLLFKFVLSRHGVDQGRI